MQEEVKWASLRYRNAFLTMFGWFFCDLIESFMKFLKLYTHGCRVLVPLCRQELCKGTKTQQRVSEPYLIWCGNNSYKDVYSLHFEVSLLELENLSNYINLMNSYRYILSDWMNGKYQ